MGGSTALLGKSNT